MSWLPVGATINDRFVILSRIGQGGMGDVYLANDYRLNRKVAIKVIAEKHKNNNIVLQRIERECRLHALAGAHPHIVTLYDKIEFQGQTCLIMEYVYGFTLSALINSACVSNRYIPTQQCLIIIKHILEALNCLHRLNIIHRDIKPANIIIRNDDTRSPEAKLMDFGVASQDNEHSAQANLTQISGGTPGTPLYMAPERIDSGAYGQPGAQSDLYSVGIILYELLLNKPPFTGTTTEILSGHLVRDFTLPNDNNRFPEFIKRIICKSLQKKVAARYSTALEFLSDIEKILQGASQLPEQKEHTQHGGGTTIVVQPQFVTKKLRARSFPQITIPKIISPKYIIAIVAILTLSAGYTYFVYETRNIVQKNDKRSLQQSVGTEETVTHNNTGNTALDEKIHAASRTSDNDTKNSVSAQLPRAPSSLSEIQQRENRPSDQQQATIHSGNSFPASNKDAPRENITGSALREFSEARMEKLAQHSIEDTITQAQSPSDKAPSPKIEPLHKRKSTAADWQIIEKKSEKVQ